MKRKINVKPKFELDELVAMAKDEMKNVTGGEQEVVKVTLGSFTIPPTTIPCDRLSGCGSMSGW